MDQFGQVIDVYLSPSRDAMAARRFFERAIGRARVSPVEVTTDRYRVYPRVLDQLLPAAFHDTEVHANNPLETDHGRLRRGSGRCEGSSETAPPRSSSPPMPSSRTSAVASTIWAPTYHRLLGLPTPSPNWPW